MATFTNVGIGLHELPEAARLLDLTSIKRDFKLASEYAEKVQSLLISGQAGIDELDAFALAAFVRYGRCFMSGPRSSVQKEIQSELASDPDHQWCHEIRTGAYAHSIGNNEAHQLCAWLNPIERGRRVLSLSVLESFVVSDPQAFAALSRAASRGEAVCERKIAEEKALLEKLVSERLPLEELYARSVPGPGDVTLRSPTSPRRRI